MATIVITADNFDTEVLASDKPVLVDFWASWCGPCRALGPTIDEIAAEHPEIKVGKVNVDDNVALAKKFHVLSIPTLAVFKDGALTGRSVGVQPKDSIVALLNK
ncbi:MAG: thioredoxin [Megasphaera sp.]|jgi:thioredoxin 1|nr:thioredoxin [Megasphaera sp.]MCH4218519.1 thioredoxin [Megasphaera sp.]